uniref:anti-sigma factor family protein n=1 Tax=Nonomuraea pusilla TaxID=46177 RepID=UPI0009E7BFCB|nr:zf-HC2 domain-containing protein [Nonomuraea pusilla]
MMTCEEVRVALGAHALGALDPDEALEVDNHLATCEECGAELLDLEGVAAFLGKVSERDVELVSSPPRQVLDRLLNARARRSRRGRLLLAVAASAAAVAVGGAVWTAARPPSGGQATSVTAQGPMADASAAQGTAPPAAESSEAASAFAADGNEKAMTKMNAEPSPSGSATTGREFSRENGGYRATVSAFPGANGTELSVGLSGVPVGTTCRLVVVGASGRRDLTQSWTVTRETVRDKSVFRRQTDLSMSDIIRFDLVDGSGKLLVRVPVRDGK